MTLPTRRRELLVALAAAAATPWLGGCRRDERAKPSAGRGPASSTAADRSGAAQRWMDLPFAAVAGGAGAPEKSPQLAALLKVEDAPLLIALHGRGEAGRGLAAGAHGWRDDYDLDVAHQRLGKPPLRTADFHSFVRNERLAQLNASLAAHAYAGVAVACPYTPALSDRSVKGSRPFANFLIEQLIPRCRKQLGASVGTGIDGVSMGGRLALLIGLSRPDVFRTVGAMQPAIGERESQWLSKLARDAKDAGQLPHIRLLSSSDDPFLPAVSALSAQFKRDGIAHQTIVTPGPHDYIWNRGPGAYEMLLWHERMLRGWPAPGV